MQIAAKAGNILLLTLAVSMPVLAAESENPTADEIITRLEENRTYNSYSEMSMTIQDRFGERVSTLISWSRGAEESLIEFTSPGERGQKVLRTEDEIYLYYPDAAEIIRLQGQALRESMLGSDVSYEDLTGGKTLLDTYTAVLEGRETVEGHDTWKISLEAFTRDVAYPKQVLWIDTELYVTWRAEQYSLNGRLLKTVIYDDYIEAGGLMIPMLSVISDALKSNSSTTVEILSIEVGIDLEDSMFGLEELSW